VLTCPRIRNRRGISSLRGRSWSTNWPRLRFPGQPAYALEDEFSIPGGGQLRPIRRVWPFALPGSRNGTFHVGKLRFWRQPPHIGARGDHYILERPSSLKPATWQIHCPGGRRCDGAQSSAGRSANRTRIRTSPEPFMRRSYAFLWRHSTYDVSRVSSSGPNVTKKEIPAL